MKRILFSIGMIVGAIGVVAGGTTAFFSDTETSAGNSFTAGTLDLLVDNESYYNGAISQATTFGPSNLDEGKLFINFRDLKPDDEGEDTISLHVNNNDAYLCMDMAVTSNDDVSSNEPELESGDPQNDPANTWDGELGSLVKMVWWVDDGDNVLEEGETLLNGGVQNLLDLFGEDKVFTADLADATTNVWNPNTPGPVAGGSTHYIAKGWCYGNMTLNPLAQDGVGTDGPLEPNRLGTGFTCDGSALGNESQTDKATMNISFRAVQARHNPRFTCEEEQQPLGTITVVKVVTNDNGGTKTEDDFPLFVSDGVNTTPVTRNVANPVSPGSYTVSETQSTGYTATFSGDCDANGVVTVASGQNKVCTITNNDNTTSLTLNKIVDNSGGGTAQESAWTLTASGPTPISGPGAAGSADVVSGPTFSAGVYTLSESAGPPGYTSGPWSCVGGTQNGNQITIGLGESATCSITNSSQPATITVTKVVLNNHGGNNVIGDFQLFVGVTPVTSGSPVNLPAGQYQISEIGAAGYQADYGGDCAADGSITLVSGNAYNCTVTNDDIQPNITLIKNVVGGTAQPNQFTMRVNNVAVPSGSSRSVNSNTNVTITEDAFSGYTATSITGAGCPASLGVPFKLSEGVAITCTITNTANP